MKISKLQLQKFIAAIYSYYKERGRHTLPWRLTTNPYHIFVSEVMLQQTQVDRVIPKYLSFIEKFPAWESLANASQKDILTYWQGLGYNRRALMLQKAATEVWTVYHGVLPNTIEELILLPGIGYATASSIRAFAFNLAAPFIETNIRSVYIHHFFKDQEKVADAEILKIVEKTIDIREPRIWFWALMDYGVMLKKQMPNPSRKSKQYTQQSVFKDSNRFVRGAILKYLLKKSRSTKTVISAELKIEKSRIENALSQLVAESFITKHEIYFSIR